MIVKGGPSQGRGAHVTAELQPGRVGRGGLPGARSGPLLTRLPRAELPPLLLFWQSWPKPQLALLGWQPGKAMDRAGRQVTRSGSIPVQLGLGSACSC